MRYPEAPDKLKSELDRCVKCGMCLPECPTYRLESNENESPRGRIALIEGLIGGRLDVDEPLIRHLDNCLGCRRCERVCPSQVRYGYLIDQARQMTARPQAVPWMRWIQSPALQYWGTRLAQAVPAGLSRPLGPVHRLHRLARALQPGPGAPAPGGYPADTSDPRGRVGLFAGCASAAQQGGALHAALRLLQRAGYEVTVPAGSGCCGALSQHAGDSETAARLAAANRAAFVGPLDAVLSIASGCGNQLDSYAPPLSAGHQDICRFLLEQRALGPDDFLPLARQVLLHVPCSVENVYAGGGWARQLLAWIPGLEIRSVGETGQCCGAAGDYMIRHPAQAARLREPTLEQVPADPGQIVLTSNVGCAMHLAEGLRGRGSTTEVLHPVELLARQLRP